MKGNRAIKVKLRKIRGKDKKIGIGGAVYARLEYHKNIKTRTKTKQQILEI